MNSLLVLLAILAIGLLIINGFAWMERRKMKRKVNGYPSARKYSKEVNRLLEFDENSYS